MKKQAGLVILIALVLVTVAVVQVRRPDHGPNELPPATGRAIGDDERRETVEFWEQYRRGMAARRMGQWAEAIDAFTKALETRPEHETSHYYMASSLFEVGEYQAAVTHWATILEHNPESSRANVQLAAIHSIPDLPELFHLEKARAHLERALEINPEETGPLIRLGEVEVAMGNLVRGEDLLEKSRLTNPRATSAHYLCAYLAWVNGDEQQATADLELALDALRVSRQTSTPMLEGDIRIGDSENVIEETMSSRRLFASLLADLASRGTGLAEAEAARVGAYLVSLPPRGEADSP